MRCPRKQYQIACEDLEIAVASVPSKDVTPVIGIDKLSMDTLGGEVMTIWGAVRESVMRRVPSWDTSFPKRIVGMYDTGNAMSLRVKVTNTLNVSCFRNSPSDSPSDEDMMCLEDLYSARFKIG